MSASFGDLVRRGREDAGLSQTRLATLVGRSAATIRAWEHGRTNPSDRQSVAALAAVLGLDENELMGRAGFEATQARAPLSARQELTSLATERTEMIALIPPGGGKSRGSEGRPRPKHSSPKHSLEAAADLSPARPAPEDEVVEMPVIESATMSAPAVLTPEITVSEVAVPEAPLAEAALAEAALADAPLDEAPLDEAPVFEASVIEAPVPADVSPSAGGTAPKTEVSPLAVEKSPLATKSKPRVVLTHRMAPGPTQAASNGFVSGISYIEDEAEKDFYRRRGAITAIVLAFMVIVIWWAFGRTGSAIGDFFESIIGAFDI